VAIFHRISTSAASRMTGLWFVSGLVLQRFWDGFSYDFWWSKLWFGWVQSDISMYFRCFFFCIRLYVFWTCLEHISESHRNRLKIASKSHQHRIKAIMKSVSGLFLFPFFLAASLNNQKYRWHTVYIMNLTHTHYHTKKGMVINLLRSNQKYGIWSLAARIPITAVSRVKNHNVLCFKRCPELLKDKKNHGYSLRKLNSVGAPLSPKVRPILSWVTWNIFVCKLGIAPWEFWRKHGFWVHQSQNEDCDYLIASSSCFEMCYRDIRNSQHVQDLGIRKTIGFCMELVVGG
jgi:hypothetical protein